MSAKMLGRAQGFGLRLDARAVSTTTPHRVSAPDRAGERRDVRPLSRELTIGAFSIQLSSCPPEIEDSA